MNMTHQQLLECLLAHLASALREILLKTLQTVRKLNVHYKNIIKQSFLLYIGNKYWVTKVLTTMECIAPILAQARSATESSTIMGM